MYVVLPLTLTLVLTLTRWARSTWCCSRRRGRVRGSASRCGALSSCAWWGWVSTGAAARRAVLSTLSTTPYPPSCEHLIHLARAAKLTTSRSARLKALLYSLYYYHTRRVSIQVAPPSWTVIASTTALGTAERHAPFSNYSPHLLHPLHPLHPHLLTTLTTLTGESGTLLFPPGPRWQRRSAAAAQAFRH